MVGKNGKEKIKVAKTTLNLFKYNLELPVIINPIPLVNIHLSIYIFTIMISI